MANKDNTTSPPHINTIPEPALASGFLVMFFPIIMHTTSTAAGNELAPKALSRCPSLKKIPKPIPIIISDTQPIPNTSRECISASISAKVSCISD